LPTREEEEEEEEGTFRELICAPVLVADPQQVFPLPQVAFEAHASGNLKGRDHAPLD
jgi:hypothetical protein